VNRLSVRLRLTLVFACVIAVLLTAIGVFVYARLAADLDGTIDTGLRGRATELASVAGSGNTTLSTTRYAGLVESGESVAEILSADGRVLDATPPLGRRPLLTPDEVSAALQRTLIIDRQPPGFDEPLRVLATPLTTGDAHVVGVIGVTLGDRNDALSSLRTLLLLAAPIALVVSALAAYVLAAAALRPVEAMRRRAAVISATTSGERLPVPPSGDELARLGETLNEMIGRLSAAVERERRFVAEASHELRTPLSLLKTEIELALEDEQPRAELVAALRSAGEETDRLIALADDLLVLARADDGHLVAAPQRVGVAGLFERLAARFSRAAADQGRTIHAGDTDGLIVTADPARLEQALGNLLDNALRHGEGVIGLRAVASSDTVELHVTDQGTSLDEDALPTLFDRFTRGANARSSGNGSGLGLAVVKAVAEAHAGTAHAALRADGLDVWIALPASPPDE
jgi:signal transduction histidine kinase